MYHKYRTNLLNLQLVLLLLCSSLVIYAQETGDTDEPSAPVEQLGKGKGTNKIPVNDSIRRRFDEAKAAIEKANNPTFDTDTLTDNRPNSIKYSKDSLSAEVVYEASDSMLYDVAGEKIYLFGNASLKYEDMTLTASNIIFDWANDIAVAYGHEDSLGNYVGKPEFIDGDQQFNSDTIRYNYRTRKGKVYNVRTQEGDGYLLSRSVKFDMRSQEDPHKDDIAFAEGTIYTTCDAEHPHFGVRSRRAKIIPNKLIVVGSSNVEIENIPTPLWLPFGFFPLKTGQRSGLIFPRRYESDPKLGFGLRNVGYYTALNDYFDLQVTGTIYTRGSWGLNASSNYKKRYKYNGGFGLNYSYQKLDIKGVPDYGFRRDFNISWQHNQDRSAHPSRVFSADLNIGTGSYYSNNFNDANSVLNNTLRSNVRVDKNWPGKPYSMSASFRHSQNTSNGDMTITFPQVNFNVSQIKPFERKNSVGKPKWYEDIGFVYSAKAENRVNTIDSLLFTEAVFDDMKYGVEHRLTPSVNFTILKYITVTPSVNYTEKWYLNTLNRTFDPATLIESDTIFGISAEGDTSINSINVDTIFGQIIDGDKFGFRALREVSGGISMNTTLYGMLPLGKKGQAIRHVMRPNISMSFSPDYEKPFWNYYEEVLVDNRFPDSVDVYSPFEEGIYGSVPRGGRRATMSFGINNTLEGKFKARRDTSQQLKKVKLLNSFSINSSYNFAADSLKLAPISINGNTKLFKVVDLRFGASLDPYSRNEDGVIVDVFQWEANRRLVRFNSGFINLSTRLDPQKIEETFRKNKDENADKPTRNQGKKFIGSLNFSYSIRFANAFENGKDTLKITAHDIRLSGTTFNLTDKFSMRVGGIGYDFARERITYPDFEFYRDLHCWETGLSWQPERRTYAFFLRVKPSSLDFLKIPYTRNQLSPFEF